MVVSLAPGYAGTAQAQRTDVNAVMEATDGFGASIGPEVIGL